MDISKIRITDKSGISSKQITYMNGAMGEFYESKEGYSEIYKASYNERDIYEREKKERFSGEHFLIWGEHFVAAENKFGGENNIEHMEVLVEKHNHQINITIQAKLKQ